MPARTGPATGPICLTVRPPGPGAAAGQRPRARPIAAAALAGAAVGAGAVAGGLGGLLGHRSGRPAAAGAAGSTTVPFYGPHQAGIATPAQDRLAFGTLNVVRRHHAAPTCATCCGSGPRPRPG